MGKRCIICEKTAEYVVKGTSDYYCVHDAEEFFGDINLLQKVETQAKKLHSLIEEQINVLDDTGQEEDKA